MLDAVFQWFKQRRQNLEISRSIREFQNRKQYTLITPEILNSIDDDLVEQAVFDSVIKRMKPDLSDELEVLDPLSPGAKFLYASWIVDGEVNNGGFNQYFWNTEGATLSTAIEAFHFFGLPEVSQLLVEAGKVWESEQHFQTPLKEVGTLQAFSDSYKESDLDRFDSRYYDLASELSSARIAMIRSKPEMFSIG